MSSLQRKATIWITAKEDEERVYAQAFEPDEARILSMAEQGYTVFRVEVPLPFEDGSASIEPPVALKPKEDHGKSTRSWAGGNGADTEQPTAGGTGGRPYGAAG